MAAIVTAAQKPRANATALAAASFALICASPVLAQNTAPGLDGSLAQWIDCGCYDRPSKHYPYSIVVFKSAERDLVTRPQRRDGALAFSPLAVRYGTRYCATDSEQDCYGSSAQPCAF